MNDLIIREDVISGKMPAVISGQVVDVVPVSYIKKLSSVQSDKYNDAMHKITNASFTGNDGLDYVETLVALDALKLIGEPCKDVISRSAVRLIEIDPKSARKYQTQNLDDAYDDGFYDAIQEVLHLPSVRPFHNITMNEVLAYLDGMPEDVWQDFVACLEYRGWNLERKTSKWCGSEFA